MRYTSSRGEDPRTRLVVDGCERVDDAAIAALTRFMHGYGCPNGLLFDDEVCVLLRDTFTDLSEASIREERRIPARVLLATLGDDAGNLAIRVGRWLELSSRSWQAAIPMDSEDAQELLYDVASAASGAAIHPWSAAA